MSRPALAALLIGAGVVWLLIAGHTTLVLGLVAGFMVLWLFRRK